ncbi:sporulation protein YunB [Anaerospora hongkongensis]|jgi:sporulation protein YunB|uniref:Sporulation protein YunB n=1 Tax=Anaerospora hongkongensis TaxID=244830 RepID=A0A4R1Q3H8_9FIRM|nr:sporulation protein YunB [Anaerospora hongkongensis]TCL35802.1 sporulation protein YunB [Anaerospora hongkongensis]
MRFSVRRKKIIPRLWLTAVLLLSLSVYFFWIVESNLKPTLLTIAEARATLIATQTINNVINEKISAIIDPQSLITVRVDDHGKVVLIQPNAMEFNKLAADTTIKVQDGLRAIADEKIYIPIGQVVGSQLIASWGPNIVVTIIPVGTVQVNVVDKFEQAGINQTRHMVYLMATTTVRIVIPLVSKSVSVNTQVPITEYVVVGEVPNTYVQFPFPFTNELGHTGNTN